MIRTEEYKKLMGPPTIETGAVDYDTFKTIIESPSAGKIWEETSPPVKSTMGFGRPILTPKPEAPIPKPPEQEYEAFKSIIESPTPTPQREGLPERGVIGDIASALTRGVVVGVPQFVGGMVSGVGALTGIEPLKEAGAGIQRFAQETVPEAIPFVKPSRREVESPVWRAVTGTVEMIPTLVGTGGPIGAGARLGVRMLGQVAPKLKLAGSMLGQAAGLFGTFSLSAKGQSYEEAKNAGLSEEEAQEFSNKIALIEGGVWSLLSPITHGTGILAKKLLPTAEAAKTIKALLTPSKKESLVHLATHIPLVAGAGATSAALQAKTREAYGIETPTPEESAIHAIGPAVGLSILFGTASRFMNRMERNRTFQALTNPEIDPNERVRASMDVYYRLRGINKDLADQWYNKSLDLILNKKEPIPIDIDYASWLQTREPTQEIPKGPTPTVTPSMLPVETGISPPWEMGEGVVRPFRTYFGPEREWTMYGGETPRTPIVRPPIEKEPRPDIYINLMGELYKYGLDPTTGKRRLFRLDPAEEPKMLDMAEERKVKRELLDNLVKQPQLLLELKPEIARKYGPEEAPFIMEEKPSIFIEESPGVFRRVIGVDPTTNKPIIEERTYDYTTIIREIWQRKERPGEKKKPTGEIVAEEETVVEPVKPSKTAPPPTYPVTTGILMKILDVARQLGGLSLDSVMNITGFDKNEAKSALNYMVRNNILEYDVSAGKGFFPYKIAGSYEEALGRIPKAVPRGAELYKSFGYIRVSKNNWEIFDPEGNSLGIVKSREEARRFIDEAVKERQEKKPVGDTGDQGEGPPPPPTPEPNVEEIVTPKGIRAETKFEVVELKDLITSITPDRKINPNYPMELQPRDRERVASERQISKIVAQFDPTRLGSSRDAALGAPIVGPDNVVESGNARTVALNLVYLKNPEKAEQYRKFIIEEATKRNLGITPEQIQKMEMPVLIRRRTTPFDEKQRIEFALDANRTPISEMSSSELAKADASYLTADILRLFDSRYAVNSPENADFVAAFIAKLSPEQYNRFITEGKEGVVRLSTDGVIRLNNALFAKAYGLDNSDFLVSMLEDPNASKSNIAKALYKYAPTQAKLNELAKAGELYDVANIGQDIGDAVQKYLSLREAGTKISEYLMQKGMFKENAFENELITLFDQFAREPSKITEVFERYAEKALEFGNPKTPPLFGEPEVPAKHELLRSVREAFAKEISEKTPEGKPPEKPPGEDITITEKIPEKDKTIKTPEDEAKEFPYKIVTEKGEALAVFRTLEEAQAALEEFSKGLQGEIKIAKTEPSDFLPKKETTPIAEPTEPEGTVVSPKEDLKSKLIELGYKEGQINRMADETAVYLAENDIKNINVSISKSGKARIFRGGKVIEIGPEGEKTIELGKKKGAEKEEKRAVVSETGAPVGEIKMIQRGQTWRFVDENNNTLDYYILQKGDHFEVKKLKGISSETVKKFNKLENAQEFVEKTIRKERKAKFTDIGGGFLEAKRVIPWADIVEELRPIRDLATRFESGRAFLEAFAPKTQENRWITNNIQVDRLGYISYKKKVPIDEILVSMETEPVAGKVPYVELYAPRWVGDKYVAKRGGSYIESLRNRGVKEVDAMVYPVDMRGPLTLEGFYNRTIAWERKPPTQRTIEIIEELKRLRDEAKGIRHLHILDSVDSAPDYIRDRFDKDTLGVTNIYNGHIYIIADRIKTIEEARRVFFHEGVGHYGLARIMGDDIFPLLDQAWGKYQNQIKDYVRTRRLEDRKKIDLTTKAGQMRATWEYIATVAENPKFNQPLLTRVISYIRDWLRRKGWFVKDINDQDIIFYLRKSKDAIYAQDNSPWKALSLEKQGYSSNLKKAGEISDISPPFLLNMDNPLNIDKMLDPLRKIKEKYTVTFPGVDLGAIESIYTLPWFVAKKFPKFEKLINTELNREEYRESLNTKLLSKAFEESPGNYHEFLLLPKEQAQKLFKLMIDSDDRNIYITDNAELQRRAHEIGIGALSPEQIRAYHAWKKTMDTCWELVKEQHETLAFAPFEGMPWYGEIRKAFKEWSKKGDIGSFANYVEDVYAGNLFRRGEPLETLNEMIVAAKRLERSTNRIKELRREMGRWNYYVPRIREKGDIVIRGYDEKGEIVWSIRVGEDIDPSKLIAGKPLEVLPSTRARVIYDKMTKLHPDLRWAAMYEPRTPEHLYQEINDNYLMQFIQKAIRRAEAKEKITQEEADLLSEALYQSVADDLKARGFASHFIMRELTSEGKAIKGYETENGQRVLYDYIHGLTGFLTKQRAAFDFYESLKDIDPLYEKNLFKYSAQYVKDMLRNQTKNDRISGMLRAGAFGYYLAGNIKTAMAQITQNFITGIPFLGRETKNPTKKYLQAMADVALNRLTQEEKAVDMEGISRGIATAQYLREIKGRMQSNIGGAYDKVVEFFSIPFSGMEIYNRRSALIAMYRAARNPERIDPNLGYDPIAFKKARDFVYDTHYLYGKVNLPQWARGESFESSVLWRTAYTFRSFIHNYVLGMVHSLKGPGGKPMLDVIGRSVAFLALFGGATAIPFMDDIIDAFERLTGNDYRHQIRKALKGFGGDLIHRFGMEGLPAIFGFDLSGPLKIEVPSALKRLLSGETTDLPALASDTVYGVWGGLFDKLNNMVLSFKRGDWDRFFESMSPSVAENIFKAIRIHTEGVTTPSGKIIYDPETLQPLKATAYQAGLQAMGFRPWKIAEVSKEKRTFQNIDAYFKEKRDDIYARLRLFPTPEERKEILRDVQKYNLEAQKYKGQIPLINASEIKQAIRQKPEEKFVRFYHS